MTKSDKEYLDLKIDPMAEGINELKEDNKKQWEHISKLSETSNKSCVNIARLDEQVKTLFRSKRMKRPRVANHNGNMILRVDPNLVGRIIFVLLLIIAAGLGVGVMAGGT